MLAPHSHIVRVVRASSHDVLDVGRWQAACTRAWIKSSTASIVNADSAHPIRT